MIKLVLFMAAALCSVQGAHLPSRLNKSHIECLNQGNPGTLVADELVSKTIFQSVKIRVPENGLLSSPISCILVIDNNNGAREPQITQGGLSYNYVEVTIQPFLLETLNYRIQVYTETPTTTAAPTAATTPTSPQF